MTGTKFSETTCSIYIMRNSCPFLLICNAFKTRDIISYEGYTDMDIKGETKQQIQYIQ